MVSAVRFQLNQLASSIAILRGRSCFLVLRADVLMRPTTLALGDDWQRLWNMAGSAGSVDKKPRKAG